jgi:hypothetical protein
MEEQKDRREAVMDKEYTTIEVIIISLFSTIIALVIAHSVGRGHARDDVRREAVKAGAARYVPDPDGEAKFEWVAPAEKKP